jgi:2,5-dihydroxypyridine 5,6-dioxygenase
MPVLTGNLRYLRAPFVANIEPGQNVLVLSDTAHDERVWQAVMSVISEQGAEPTLALFEPRPADYFNPPPAVCDAMLRSDVNVLLASTGMLHSPANAAAMAAGVPCICMDGGMTLEMFQSGAVTEDPEAMAVFKHRVARNVFGADAKECRVTSRHGSDLTYRVDGRVFVPPLPAPDFDPYKIVDFAKADAREGSKLLFYLFPTGELNVAPIEGSANGVLVVDLTMHHLDRLSGTIALHVEDGRVVDIQGDADAFTLRRYLQDYGDENAYMFPAEASVGINRRALVRGIQREDKNIWGAMHFGLGTNVDVGGSIESRIHLDAVVLEPTLYVDGEERIRDGRFLVPVEMEDQVTGDPSAPASLTAA